jgi:hypothetical protein
MHVFESFKEMSIPVLCKKSESKNHSFWLFQNPEREPTIFMKEPAKNDPMVL